MLSLRRLDGGELVVDASALARHFFELDPSSVGIGAYDTHAGQTARDRIETSDVAVLNRTMRARTPHSRWEALLDRTLPWLAAIDPSLDLIQASEQEWAPSRADALVRDALHAVLAPAETSP
jgi:hypothetical protein